MNFRTESFDFPQNEQRRCLSWDMAGGLQMTPPNATAGGPRAARGYLQLRAPRASGQATNDDDRPFLEYRPVLPIFLLRLDHLVAHDLASAADHRIDDAVVLGLLGGHEPVAIRVLLDAIDRLPGMLGHQLVQLRAKI